MDIDSYQFALEYSKEKEINYEDFLTKEAFLPFDSNCINEMKAMMRELALELKLQEEYSYRKLEIVLRYELPFFATNRRLVKNWLMENFIY
jgi:hypothetical protein